MKYHYTLAQQFIPENNEENLIDYLDKNDIEYKVSAEFTSELKRLGYVNQHANYNDFLKTYVVLIEEEAISLIKLRIDGVCIVKNSSFVDLKNKIRKIFKVFLK